MEIAQAPAGGRTTEWSVRVTVVEDDADTTAEAVLVTDTGARVAALGRSHRNEHDESAPEIGDEVAVARALRRLADAVLETARSGIERRTGEHPVPVRPR
jgi:hypothetical protein